MASAAANLALILLGIFALIGLTCWYFKTQVTVFARTLLERRRQQQEPTAALTQSA